MNKKYTVRYHNRAKKQLQKMDRSTALLLLNWIETNLIGCSDPRSHGKALKGELASLWRYRVGDYRILAEIRDEEVIILIVNIGHRREIYR